MITIDNINNIIGRFDRLCTVSGKKHAYQEGVGGIFRPVPF